MVTLWIGDLRTKQLQNIYQVAQQAAEYHYLVEDLAELSWLKGNVTAQLPTMSLENANVIIMLGFTDCLYSSVWDSFKIDRIAEQYASTINELVADYTNFNFYVCSVNPVDGDYPFAESTNGVISKNKLDEKIKLFNSTLKSKCQATFIDSYNYLMTTGFTTRDGVRFTIDTCNILHSYIVSNLDSTVTGTFLPRISEPNPEVDSYSYWEHTSLGGENPFPLQGESESTLPSCTAYAWGRFYEILGETPKLSTDAAEYWYLADGTHSYGNDGYRRGDTPKVGAIACWQGGEIGGAETGYVAVVEQVQPDGSIITSESGWTTEGIWRLQDREKGNGNWGMDDSYTFQGFIYCPQTVNASKEELCTKNSYNISIDEMKPNAQYIWQYLGSRGWTLNAVAGLLGNLHVESKMSPAIWESVIEGSNPDGTLNMAVINNYYSSHSRYPGYGLVQWTPYTKYTDWCTDNGLNYWDIESQLQRIEYEAANKIQWIARSSKGYDLTFSEFISSTKSAAWLAEAFAFCYERPASSTGIAAEQDALRAERGANGDFWYSFLSAIPMAVSSDQLKISNFKVDRYLTTEASVSFLTNDYITGKCTIFKNGTKIKDNTVSTEAGYTTFTFKNLVPASAYTVQLDVLSDSDEPATRELSFVTLQDYPESVKKVELTSTDEILSVDSLFTLNITKPDSLGYWDSVSGYEVALIVNNKKIKTITVNNAKQDISWNNFSINNKFGYQSKLCDKIQIGVRVWTEDDYNTKLYDSQVFKCSKPICLLNKPVTLYLNK